MSKRNRRDLFVEYLSVATLTADPRNPRQHSDRQVKQIARSMESFGCNVPILIDASNKILAGHGRKLAAEHLGWQQVPVVRLDHLTAAQARAFSIADNRLTENATWSEKLLGHIFFELSAADLDFSLEVTGFSMAEIDLMIEGQPVVDDAPDPADSLPEPLDLPAVTKPGDQWQFDRHRLLCADARERKSYKLLMSSAKAHTVFTDPPYNVAIQGNVSGKGAHQHREFAMASGEMSSEAFTDFLATTLNLIARHSTPGSIHFICIDWRHQLELLNAGQEAYTELKNVCVWVKHNAGMGSLYRSAHELVFVFKSGKGRHRNNVQLGQFGRNRTNVWNYPGANTIGRGTDEGNLLALHPTVKPVRLVADALLDCSMRGDIVLDPFLGSGTTLIAAERTGRCCYGVEIDPLYVDTIVRRWQAYTGGRAVHAISGRTFDEIAAEALHGE